MGKLKFDKEPSIIKSKTFYIALIICFVALGISSYTAVTRIKGHESAESQTQTSSNKTSAPSSAVSNVENTSTAEDPKNTPSADSSQDTIEEEDSVLTGGAPFFTLPVAGEVIKDYDENVLQYSHTYKDWRLHLGVDFSGAKGCPVYASAQGVVEDIYQDAAWGTVVAIDHGEGIMGYYCGLGSKPVVKIGETVESGKQIGTIDTIPCEYVEQSHLHFHLEKDGVPLSPLEMIHK